LIYSHKPQRSGRSIQANTNNPPQDPPPPVPEPCVEEKLIITIPEKKISKPQITKTTKPKPKVTPKVTVTPKVSLFRRFITKILRIFGRK